MSTGVPDIRTRGSSGSNSAVGRAIRVRRAWRGARELLGGRGHHAAVDGGLVEDLERELVPRALAAADQVVDAGCAPLGDLDQRGGEVAGPRGTADLIGDHAELVGRLGERQHGVDEVLATGAVEPSRARDRPAATDGRDLELAGELRAPVGGARGGLVGLDVRLAPVAREDVVGRDVDEHRRHGLARPRDVARGLAVDARGQRLGALRRVDVGVGGAVDDRVGLLRGQPAAHRIVVEQVEIVDVRAHGVVAELARLGDDAVAEHAGGSRDEQAHQRIPISELSPTMKRYARGCRPSSRETTTLRPSSDDSIRPERLRTCAPASRIECSISACSTTQSSAIAV